MKRLITSLGTGEFLTERGEWTNDISKAQVFKNDVEAREARARFNLEEVGLYYWFETLQMGKYDFTIRL